jgi:glycosyltransferase involved in cell wall biosynthesis
MWQSVRTHVRTVLAEFSPDCVLTYWAHPDGSVGVRLGRQLDVPVGVIVGGSDVLRLPQQRLRRRKVIDVLQSSNAVITVSRGLKEVVCELGIRPGKIRVVYQGIDSSVFCPGDREEARRRLRIPGDAFVLLWVGRFHPQKGLELLLEACARLRQGGVAFHLYLLGYGALERALQAQTRRLGLGMAVHFVGPRPYLDLPDWYRAANCYVLPSRWEGLPNVLRESLACGTPFVATNVGSVAEIADERWSRLVVPEDVTALTEALKEVITDQNLSGPVELHPISWSESARQLVYAVTSKAYS